MGSTVTVRHESAAQIVSIGQSSGIKLDFRPEEAGLERSGSDLVFTFQNNDSIVLKGFFAEKELPVVELADGSLYSGKDFLNAFNSSISTEAGPSAPSAEAGHLGGYSDNGGSLIDGVNRLGSLGTDYWDRAAKEPERDRGLLLGDGGSSVSSRTGSGTANPAAPGYPAGPTDPGNSDGSGAPEDPADPGNPGDSGTPAGPVFHMALTGAELTLDEALLPGGSRGGANGPEVSGTLSLDVATDDTLVSFTINGVVYPVENGTLQGFSPISDASGFFHSPKIVQNPQGGYTLTLEYTLEAPYAHTPGGEGTERAATLEITAKGLHCGGNTAFAGVNVIDDNPAAAHDLGTLHLQNSAGGPVWTADGNMLTSEGSRATASGGEGAPAWVNVSSGIVYKDVQGADGASVSRFQYTNLNGDKVWAEIPMPSAGSPNPSVTVSDIKEGGSITVYRDGTYHYEAPYKAPATEAVTGNVQMDFGGSPNANGFSFSGFSGICVGRAPTLEQVLAAKKANITYSDTEGGRIGVYSGGNDANSFTGSSGLGEGVLIGTAGVWPHGLQSMSIGLAGLSGQSLVQVEVFGTDGRILSASEYSLNITNGVVGITVTEGSGCTIGQVLLAADRTAGAPGVTDLYITKVSGTYTETHVTDSNTPRVAVTYELTDSDGGKSTASLVLEHDAPALIVGTNQDNTTGSDTGFAVTDGPYVPKSGSIIGTSGNDILAGADTHVAITGREIENYNICILLDLSASMNQVFGDGAKTRLEVMKESFASLMRELAAYEGKVNIKVITFGTTVTAYNPAMEGNANYYTQIEALIKAVEGRSAPGSTNYEAAFTEAYNWFANTAAASGAGASNYKDYVNKVLFLTDGLPTCSSSGEKRPLDPKGNTSWSGYNGTTDMDPNDLLDARAAFQKLLGLGMGIQVSAIGMGNEIRSDVLRFFDNTTSNGFVSEAHDEAVNPSHPELGFKPVSTDSWLFGEVEIATKADELNASIAGGLNIQYLTLSNDLIMGGAGNDLIFGDVLNTDVLAKNMGVKLPAGSGWDVFRVLESDPDAHWTRDDTTKYIQTHADELGAGREGVSGGHDILIGGSGNDTVYGQNGNDLIFGGDVHFKGLHGNAAFNALVDAAGGGTDQIIDYLKGHADEIGRGTAADGANHLDGGIGNDFIIGGGGNDVIYGGKGNDTMFGGAGNDTFAWRVGDYGGKDTILDFNLHEDKLSFASLFGEGAGEITEADILSAMRAGRLDVTADDAMRLNLSVNTAAGSQKVDIFLEGHGLTDGQLNALQYSRETAGADAETEKAALLRQIMTNIAG